MSKFKSGRLVSFLMAFILMFGGIGFTGGVDVYAAANDNEENEYWSEVSNLPDRNIGALTENGFTVTEMGDPLAMDLATFEARLQSLSSVDLTAKSFKDWGAGKIAGETDQSASSYLSDEEAYIEAFGEMLAEPVGAVGFEEEELTSGTMDVIVWLQELPQALSRRRGQSRGARSGRYEYEERGARARQSIRSGMRSRIKHEYTEVFSGFALTASAADIENLANTPGVFAITPDRMMHATAFNADDDYDYVGMGASREIFGIADIHKSGITGVGVNVCVLDTGIDFRHPDFADNYIGGWNYVASAADYGRSSLGADATTPMETTYVQWENSGGRAEVNANGSEFYTSHGTHVSGTIAAAALNNTGNYRALGMAPDVNLYVARVLGPYGSGASSGILKAIEDCAADGEPDGHLPKMDVINLSLGMDVNTAYDAENVALNNAVIAGVNVSVSAGNNAGGSSDARKILTLGTPGTAYLPVTVAASQYGGDRLRTYDGVTATADNGTSATFGLMIEGQDVTNTFADDSIGGTPSPIFVPGDGYELVLLYTSDNTGDKPTTKAQLDGVTAGSLTGKILVVKRGVADFVDMAAAALRGGAGALLISNSAANGETYVTNTALNGTKDGHLPVLTAFHSTSAKLRTLANAGEPVYLRLGSISYTDHPKEPAYFSSVGPVKETWGLKPDIIAPGWSIISTQPAFITDADHDATNYAAAYASMSGTSMSAPHIAGILALMKQAYPSATPIEIKARLMNTAKPDEIGTYDGKQASVFEVGAGFVDPYRAIITEKNKGIYITVEGEIPAGDSASKGMQSGTLSSVSFGYVDPGDSSAAVSVTVYGAAPTSVSVKYHNNTHFSNNAATNGVELTYAISGSIINVTIDADEDADVGYYEGHLEISAGGGTYVVPWAVRVGEEPPPPPPPPFGNCFLVSERPIISTSEISGVRSAGGAAPHNSNSTTGWLTWEGTLPDDPDFGFPAIGIWLIDAAKMELSYCYGYWRISNPVNDGTGIMYLPDELSSVPMYRTNGYLDNAQPVANGAYYIGVEAGGMIDFYEEFGIVYTNGAGSMEVQLEVNTYLDGDVEDPTEGVVKGRIYSPALALADQAGFYWTEVYDIFVDGYIYPIDQSLNAIGVGTESDIYINGTTGYAYNMYLDGGNPWPCDEDGYFEITRPVLSGENSMYPFAADANRSIVGVEGFYYNVNIPNLMSFPVIGANKSAAKTPTWRQAGVLSGMVLKNGKLTVTVDDITALTGNLLESDFNLRFTLGNTVYTPGNMKFTYTANKPSAGSGEAVWDFTPVAPLLTDQVLQAELIYADGARMTDQLIIFGADIPRIGVKNQAFNVIDQDNVMFGVSLGYGAYGATMVAYVTLDGYSSSSAAPIQIDTGTGETQTTSGGAITINISDAPADTTSGGAIQITPPPAQAAPPNTGILLTEEIDYIQDTMKLTIFGDFLSLIIPDEGETATLTVTFDNTQPAPVTETLLITGANSTFFVMFDLKGGGPSVPPAQVASGYPVDKPTEPTRAGYRFDGWYNAANDTPWDFNTPVTANITLYAKWVGQYTVVFDANGSPTVYQSITADEGAKIPRPADPIREGFAFDSWYTEVELSNKWDFANDTVSGDMTLYAGWANAFTVKFDSKGGTSVPPATVKEGSTVPEPAEPKRSGYDFTGWYRENGVRWNFSKDTVSEDITLYAGWTAKSNPNPPPTQPSRPPSTSGGRTRTRTEKEPEPPKNTVVLIVDGEEFAPTAKVETADGQTVITVDSGALSKYINAVNEYAAIVIEGAETDSVTLDLPLSSVEEMTELALTFFFTVNGVSYGIPAGAFDTDAVKAALNNNDSSEIAVKITINTATDAQTLQQIDAALNQLGGALVVPAIEFTVSAEYGGETVSVNVFNGYVSRILTITEEEAARITTALVVEPDGTVRHVPTRVYEQDGVWYAEINSLTNSTYILIQNEQSFADTEGKWYKADADEAVSRGIFNTQRGAFFAGEQLITRAEFTAMVVNALGLPGTKGTPVFTDVVSNTPYYEQINTAFRYKLVDGRGDGTFAPGMSINWQEAMTLICKAAGLTDMSLVPGYYFGYADADSVSGWAANSVSNYVGSGLYVHQGMLRPTQNMTRAEAAAVILELLRKAELIDVRN